MDAIAWVQSELRSLENAPAQALLEPPQTFDSLCAYLKDGRALCLLTMALQNDAEMPKHLTRGMHQVTTFHALERIQFFLKWCRGYASLEEHVVFTSVQLVDEAHEKAVAATIHALRIKYRPSWVAPVFETTSEKTETVADAPEQQEEAHSEPQEEQGEVQEQEQDEEQSDDVMDAPAPVEAAKMAFKSRSNRLNSFLNKFPGSESKPAMAAVVASATMKSEEQVVEKEEVAALASTHEVEEAAASDSATIDEDERPAASRLRIPSIFKRDARGSGSASTARSSTGSASSVQSPRSTVDSIATTATAASTEAPDPEASALPRLGSVSKLEIPSVFGRHPLTAASTEAPEPEASTLPRLGSVSKLEIPSVFGRHSSGAESATSESASTPKTAPRSVSKLQIPSAFSASSSSLRTSDSSASTDQDAAAAEAVAAAPTNPIPAAPRSVSKLEIPSAFSRVKSNSSSSEQAASEPAAPTPPKASPLAAFSPLAVASATSAPAEDHDDDELLEVRPHFARSISAPVKDKSPASKLAAFLSKVETATTFVPVAAPAPVAEGIGAYEEEADEEAVEEEHKDEHEQQEDTENHPFEHHDHNDGEQPFFVVEEVSLSKPPTSSKLFAFLSAVDSAAPATGAEASADSAHSSPRSAHEKPVSRSASTSSYQSDEHVSFTEEIPVDAENPLTAKLATALETNERLTAEVVQLKQELALSTEALASKDLEISAITKELETLKREQSTSTSHEFVEAKEQELLALKEELSALRSECEDLTSKFTATQSELEGRDQKIGAIQEKSNALELQLGAELASAYATIEELSKEDSPIAEVDVNAQVEAAVQAAKEVFAQQKLALEQQLEELRAQTESQKTEISSIRKEMVELERVAQQAKDSEEAARYSAQVAFAARDKAENVSRLQREELDALRRQ